MSVDNRFPRLTGHLDEARARVAAAKATQPAAPHEAVKPLAPTVTNREAAPAPRVAPQRPAAQLPRPLPATPRPVGQVDGPKPISTQTTSAASSPNEPGEVNLSHFFASRVQWRDGPATRR